MSYVRFVVVYCAGGAFGFSEYSLWEGSKKRKRCSMFVERNFRCVESHQIGSTGKVSLHDGLLASLPLLVEEIVA
jgi:hypothetical protein